MVRRVTDEFGAVDLLVANAAAMTMGPVTEHDLGEWWRMIDVNLTGTFVLIREVLPGMRASGGGRVVVVTSEWGAMGWPQASGYSASKAGLIALVKSLGRELGPEGIAVNGIAPGVVDTPQLQVDADAAGTTLDELRRDYAGRIPVGRVGRAEEIAAAVAYLCGPFSAAMVGQIVQANGGSSRGRI
jgi:NAD(P)-dependent dehydrogenase (short-subunit alcohol dehydrogenase family)